MNCDEFQEQVDDLALGQLVEPRRTVLLSHAASCQACQSMLAGLSAVADRLLLAAPQVEPPAEFESRALARMGTSSAPRRSWWVSAVAGLVILGAVAVVGWSLAASDPEQVIAAPIVASAGLDIGVVELRSEPTPHIVVMIDAPRPDPGTRTCQLGQPDGTWVTVGTWEVDDMAAGVWAVGVEPELMAATAMRVLADGGTVLATADFSG
jgi:hypothetical protein